MNAIWPERPMYPRKTSNCQVFSLCLKCFSSPLWILKYKIIWMMKMMANDLIWYILLTLKKKKWNLHCTLNIKLVQTLFYWLKVILTKSSVAALMLMETRPRNRRSFKKSVRYGMEISFFINIQLAYQQEIEVRITWNYITGYGQVLRMKIYMDFYP